MGVYDCTLNNHTFFLPLMTLLVPSLSSPPSMQDKALFRPRQTFAGFNASSVTPGQPAISLSGSSWTSSAWFLSHPTPTPFPHTPQLA